MKLSAISYLLHINDGGVIYDATNPKFQEGGKDGKNSCVTAFSESITEGYERSNKCRSSCLC